MFILITCALAAEASLTEVDEDRSLSYIVAVRSSLVGFSWKRVPENEVSYCGSDLTSWWGHCCCCWGINHLGVLGVFRRKGSYLSLSSCFSFIFSVFFPSVTSLLGEVIVRRLLLKCGNGLEVLDWGVGRLIGNSSRVPLSYRPIKENSWKGRIARK